MKFRVHFEYFGRNISDDIELGAIGHMIQHGFWITNDLTVTNSADKMVYHIPPSRIIAIEKLQ
jgi:hypothetical protein